MTAEDIKKIINENKSDIAFVIGNGIHRYPNNDALSWDKLLIELWNIISFNDDRIRSIHKGISNTEFYDVLLLKANKYIIGLFEEKDSSKSIIENLGELINNSGGVQKISSEFRNSIELKVNDIIGESTASKKACKIERLALKLIQYILSQKMSSWESKEFHKKIIGYAERNNMPILTTNYDKALANAVDGELRKIKEQGFTYYYPWRSYYAKNELEEPLTNFGIWHINGMIHYPASIRLGLSHYMGAVNHSRKFIDKKEATLFSGKEEWAGHDTWLDIIFNKSLLFFGLGLDENETFLRWLLIQRAKYLNKFPEKKYVGWYLTTKDEIDKSPGKKFFLESVGIEILEVEDYKIINEDIWQ